MRELIVDAPVLEHIFDIRRVVYEAAYAPKLHEIMMMDLAS